MPTENYHKHHIIPRCLGGSDNSSNKIRLSYENHWYAHYLLAKENPDNEALQKAFNRLGTLEQFINKSAKHPEEISRWSKEHPEAAKKMLGTYGTSKGKKWFNNGYVSVMEYECPNGFIEGRLPYENPTCTGKHWTLTEEQRSHHCGKNSNNHSTGGMHWKLIDGKRVYFS